MACNDHKDIICTWQYKVPVEASHFSHNGLLGDSGKSTFSTSQCLNNCLIMVSKKLVMHPKRGFGSEWTILFDS